jgi:protein gp37
MAETTGISWTRSTFNPWIGCTKVGPGCDHCYAAVSTPARAMSIKWGAGEPRRHTSAPLWNKPKLWNAEAKLELEAGKRWSTGGPGFWPVFCASLADVFDNEVDDAWRAELWKLIEATPYLTWQLVTKRVGNVMKMIPEGWRTALPANVWIVATMVNQDEFDRDWPKLRAIPAKVRGLSIEPQLGDIVFPDEVRGLLHWAIYGGESKQGGADARLCRLEWILDGVTRCRRLGISPFVKQMGHNIVGNGQRLTFTGKGANPEEWPEGVHVQEFPL